MSSRILYFMGKYEKFSFLLKEHYKQLGNISLKSKKIFTYRTLLREKSRNF